MPDRRRIRDLRLTLDVHITYSSDVKGKIRILIDTGSEVNLIRRGVTLPQFLLPVKRPLKIAMASHAIMPGGDRELHCTLTMHGIEHDTREPRILELPTTFYEADIGVEAILSYEWLAMYDFIVNPGMQMLMKKIPNTGDIVCITGNHLHRAEVAGITRIDTPSVIPSKTPRPERREARKTPTPRPPRKRRMLDLFSGTGSVGATFTKLGYDVFSVDIDPKCKPTITVDVTVWEYWKCFAPKYFDVIVCCPPCVAYSRSMTSRPRDFEKADKMVRRALEIVEYYQPAFWFLENPRTRKLPKPDFMQGIPHIDVYYCMFSDWGYRKPTRIWGHPSLKTLEPRICDHQCTNTEWRETDTGWRPVHKAKLGCTPDPGKKKPTSQQAGRVPEDLVVYLLKSLPGLIPPTQTPPTDEVKLVAVTRQQQKPSPAAAPSRGEGPDPPGPTLCTVTSTTVPTSTAVTSTSATSSVVPAVGMTPRQNSTPPLQNAQVEDTLPNAEYDRLVYYVQGLQLNPYTPEVTFDLDDDLDQPPCPMESASGLGTNEVLFLARALRQAEEEPADREVCFAKGIIETREPSAHPQVDALRAKVLNDYQGRVFVSKLPSEEPPIRGPFGEAEISLKPGARPVKQRMFHITGERKEAWDRLTDEVIAAGKVEPGVGPWSSPSFPVPKKNPGEYRLVEDFRAVNENTEDDAHPLPRIDEMVQRQSEYRMWSSLDCKDGYHQMPLKTEHRHITCMSTPKGTYQWRVQVMGLKNAGAQFQRMMEWILRDLDFADPYIDDIIIGSKGSTEDELIANHERDLRAVLDTLAIHQIYVDPRKAHMFMREVEFCGHVLREGRRSPAPGKLRAIQKWEAPKSITQLRGFLGLTNYYSGYVKGYAQLAAPLMDSLKVTRAEGKK